MHIKHIFHLLHLRLGETQGGAHARISLLTASNGS